MINLLNIIFKAIGQFINWYTRKRHYGIGFVWVYYTIVRIIFFIPFLLCYFISFLFSPIEENGVLLPIDQIKGWYYRMLNPYDYNAEDRLKSAFLYKLYNDEIIVNSESNLFPEEFNDRLIKYFIDDLKKDQIDADNEIDETQLLRNIVFKLQSDTWIQIESILSAKKYKISLTPEGRKTLSSTNGHYTLYLSKTQKAEKVDQLKNDLDIIHKFLTIIISPLGVILALISLLITCNVRKDIKELRHLNDSLFGVTKLQEHRINELSSHDSFYLDGIKQSRIFQEYLYSKSDTFKVQLIKENNKSKKRKYSK